MQERKGHGWWPYWIPYFGFLLIVQFDGASSYLMPLRVVLPLAALIYFARRRSYPELRGFLPTPTGIASDVLVGVAGAAVWVAPFLLVASSRPGLDTAFDPNGLGAPLIWVTLGLRFVGFVLVTPFMEELFVRSWLPRAVESFANPKIDFRDAPIARFTARSFLVVVLWFTFSHAQWEWPVAAVWMVLTQLWFYHRKHILSVVIVHASSNLSIFLMVVFASGKLQDTHGAPLSLWFFL